MNLKVDRETEVAKMGIRASSCALRLPGPRSTTRFMD